MNDAPRRAGFVAVIGAPNVGKSTLVNRLTGAKVSIVSPKVQTTRTRVLGIRAFGQTQIAFVDTPGLFRPRRRLDRAMVAAAWGGAGEADRLLLIVDAARDEDEDTQAIIARLKEMGRRDVFLALNKVDIAAKPKLLARADRLNRTGIFSDVFMISAETGDGVDDLLAALAGGMPEGPWLFPEDQVSDMPERMLAAEITREQLYLQLQQELPYRATVETETWQERDDGSVRIEQIIYVEREGQRSIVLGKGGARIKAIGQAARTELERILERRVHLFLFVKVREKWGEDPERYRALGLDFDV
ncbi:MAG: GTPase Era [Rhodospirillales bacterium RIFCSPLOWO2_12_FULL_67_15]|nr:MAG: GTPase Era [Rhodospirillales bacterium RIFCSPLOWO2_12_FULL_67_15]